MAYPFDDETDPATRALLAAISQGGINKMPYFGVQMPMAGQPVPEPADVARVEADRIA